MKKLVRGVARDIKTAFNGLGYANVSEPTSVREKYRLLGDGDARSLAAQAAAFAPAVKSVVLAINERLEPGALKYAASVCQRMNATLDVLCVSSRRQAEAALAPHRDALAAAGIRHRVVLRSGTIPSAIAAYVSKQPDILVAVAGSGDVVDMLAVKQNRRAPRARWASDFPLVVVADQQS